jgi:DNA-binding response OmpR family regulator
MMSPVLVMGSGPWLTAWLRQVLDDNGYQSIEAYRPSELRPGSMHRAALIDLNLPDLMGWTLLETVASEVPTAVILGAEPSDASRALEMGAKAFVKRPIDPARLLAVLRFLERPEQRGSASLLDDLTGLPEDIPGR